jgi:hypothetical protein
MDERVSENLDRMDALDFEGWDKADWHGVFAHHHTDDVHVEWYGVGTTDGGEQHIAAMKDYVEQVGGGRVPQITGHPIRFGQGDWTCVVGVIEGRRMVTVAKWRDGRIAEEYIWS